MTVNGSCAMVTSTSELSDGRTPWSSASWIGGMPWPIAISIGTASEMRPPVSLIVRQASRAQVIAMDVFVARLQQPGTAELHEGALGAGVDAVRDRAHADFARKGENFASRPPPSASVSNWSAELK